MKDAGRRLIVVETDGRVGQGWAKVFGTLFIILMAIGIIDHTLTSAVNSIWAWFR